MRALAVVICAVFAGGAAWADFGDPGGADECRRQSAKFGWVAVHLDPKDSPLAAWQVEVVCPEGVKVVGIEGGAHPAFSEPAHHDSKALREKRERVVLAQYSLLRGGELPRRETRVATVMVEIPDGIEPRFDVRLVTAGTVGGDAIAANIRYETGR